MGGNERSAESPRDLRTAAPGLTSYLETDPGSRRQQMRRTAERLRRVMDALIFTDAPPDVARQAEERLDEVLALLEPHARTSRPPPNDVDRLEGFDHRPHIGRFNPLSPPIDLELEDARLVGELTFTTVHEGPVGTVHGGWIAACFDGFLGVAQSLSGSAGKTARLTIDYRRPAPVGERLRVEATIEDVRGRVIEVGGRLYNGEELCAEAQALFVAGRKPTPDGSASDPDRADGTVPSGASHHR